MQTYDDFIQQLGDREYFGQKLGLERIEQVLQRIDNPERKFPSIHIAGTNGKGSTAVVIASILKEAGYRVGLYTSPHLVDFCERVQVFSPLPLAGEGQGVRVTPNQVLHYARQIHEIETETDPLTFFELATAIAFLHFSKEKVDVAVIEVGMGGRLDATNVIKPLVSVITSIGLDHTQHLGDTVEKIAFEKAGIIKRGVPVVVGELPEEAMRVVRKVAAASVSPVKNPPPNMSNLFRNPPFTKGGVGVLGSHGEGILPKHQIQNSIVAVAAIEELKKQSWSISDDAIQKGLLKVRLPGRLETIQEEPWIILDGAHNPQAIATVRRFFETRLKGRRLKVLFGAMADKDLKGILSELAPVVHEFVFTAPDLKRAADPELLLSIGRSLGIKSRAIRPIQEAFVSARKDLQKDEVLLVTGSFYLVGDVKRCLQQDS